jgi:hypothetical protein
MARYRYAAEFKPPAPFVQVTLRNPTTGEQRRGIPAQMDTAADRTVLPEAVGLSLHLNRIGEMLVGGFGGTVTVVPLYGVLLGVHTFPPRSIEVIVHPEEQWVLLGRDVLNQLRALLDGPATALEIEEPA